MRRLLSVIIPVYNERDNLELLQRELYTVLSGLTRASEIIYVDDGSTDGSSGVLNRISRGGSVRVSVRVVRLRRNFGQTAAMQAGIDLARGELIAFLDADRQNDPRDLPKLLLELTPGWDAVFGWRKSRRDELLRSLASRTANWIIRNLFNIPIHDAGCSIKVVRREILAGSKIYGETHRILAALIFWRGGKAKEIVVHHRPRLSGQSKYGFSRTFKVVIDLATQKFLFSYGTRPAYIFGSAGIASLILGFLPFAVAAYEKVFLAIYVHRNPLFILAVFFWLLGVQFILLGLLAEIMVRVYFESQGKPTYEVYR